MIRGDKANGRVESKTISEIVASITKRSVRDIEPAASLDANLNLSSLERVELLGALEERYQVDLSEAGYSSLKTVADFDRALKGEVRSASNTTTPDGRSTGRQPGFVSLCIICCFDQQCSFSDGREFMGGRICGECEARCS